MQVYRMTFETPNQKYFSEVSEITIQSWRYDTGYIVACLLEGYILFHASIVVGKDGTAKVSGYDSTTIELLMNKGYGIRNKAEFAHDKEDGMLRSHHAMTKIFYKSSTDYSSSKNERETSAEILKCLSLLTNKEDLELGAEYGKCLVRMFEIAELAWGIK